MPLLPVRRIALAADYSGINFAGNDGDSVAQGSGVPAAAVARRRGACTATGSGRQASFSFRVLAEAAERSPGRPKRL